MNLLRKFSFPLAGLAVMALILILAAPRVVRAVTAALVEVVNTSANPAITQDISKQASQIVTLLCTSLTCVQVDQHGVPSIGQYVVPSTQSLVITSLDYNFSGTSPVASEDIHIVDYDSSSGLIKGQYEDVMLRDINATLQVSFSSGLVMSQGTHPLVLTFTSTLGTTEVFLHGYLTAN
jgi:hypothetical protein